MPTEPLESSQPLQAPGRYGSGAIAFHWIMFLLVVGVGILGLLHDDWPKATQPFWINVHAVIGLLLWFTLIARFGWRSRHAPPMLPSNVGAFARRFSSPVHWPSIAADRLGADRTAPSDERVKAYLIDRMYPIAAGRRVVGPGGSRCILVCHSKLRVG